MLELGFAQHPNLGVLDQHEKDGAEDEADGSGCERLDGMITTIAGTVLCQSSAGASRNATTYEDASHDFR